MQTPIYAAVQNNVILNLYSTKKEAEDRVREEIKRDWLSIMLKKKLRKLLKRNSNVALHTYSVLLIAEGSEIN